MSIHSVKQYQSEVEKIIDFGGSKNETAIRSAFYNLLNEYARQKGLILIPEITIKTSKGKNVTPDGTLKDSLRLDWGYWESKDEADNIDEEIDKKFKKGYPKDNILFEDSKTAILIQQENEVMRISMSDADALDRIIKEFIGYERPEVQNFHKAIELFKQDIPNVTSVLRGIIIAQEKTNIKFKEAENKFWELCKVSINPEISIDDIREMMIQHILTEDIFNTIFGETQFHRENNIARELEQVILTFFTGNTKHIALGTIQHYYNAINAAAAQIADHHEKQKFLKVVYEIFYKSYNPKAADRLGVVYTPNEIVQFMIKSTDYLLYHHFGKGIEDKGVEILDPASGTGTYICDIIDYISKDKLPYKYENEIHANEIAILPYYIANLNIEYTYKQKTGSYKEFQNLCFVDTLDNVFANLGKDKAFQKDMFAMTIENLDRIKRQNSKKISVVIGNPPYNANQMNENDNNKNRSYFLTETTEAKKRLHSQSSGKKGIGVDDRIKETFIAESTAQKTKVYDMYARFYRWAMDRINDNGIIAFITNRSFIDSRTFDGFRKCVQNDFDYAYIIDTKSDVRANPKIAGTTHNIFGIQTGVAIMLLIKKAKRENPVCQIKYIALDDFWRKEVKLQWISSNSLKDIPFENICPDKNNSWINLVENDWEKLIPIVSDDNLCVFSKYFLGVATNRDEWVYQIEKETLERQMRYFIEKYNSLLRINVNSFPNDIKWSETLKRNFELKRTIKFNKSKIIKSFYKPYNYRYFYSEKLVNDRLTGNHSDFFGVDYDLNNLCFGVIGKDTVIPFSTVSFYCINDLKSLSNAAGGNKTFALYRYDKAGNKIDNINDWGLQEFREHYELDKKKKFDNDYMRKHHVLTNSFFKITKENIFHYVYAILHNPDYRQKYELNLKRDFPRIPFYDDFYKWVKWGKVLMNLHINYETVKPYKLKEITEKGFENPKPKLKADKETGTIILDEASTLIGIPKEAWYYKLGNRSALEWILDQYKEKKPSDPTIAEKFNTYRFADYKKQVIDLLKRVCTVSVETMKIVEEMKKTKI